MKSTRESARMHRQNQRVVYGAYWVRWVRYFKALSAYELETKVVFVDFKRAA